VKVTTTGDIALNNSTTIIDGYTLQNGDRVLVKNQSTPSQNGIYIVNTAGAWSRSLDTDISSEFPGMAVYVQE
jgi:phage-related tail fiber protein